MENSIFLSSACSVYGCPPITIIIREDNYSSIVFSSFHIGKPVSDLGITTADLRQTSANLRMNNQYSNSFRTKYAYVDGNLINVFHFVVFFHIILETVIFNKDIGTSAFKRGFWNCFVNK